MSIAPACGPTQRVSKPLRLETLGLRDSPPIRVMAVSGLMQHERESLLITSYSDV